MTTIMTKEMSRVGYLLLLAVLLGGFASAPPAQGRVATPQADNRNVAADPAADEFTKQLARDLTGNGFQVSQGYPKLYTLDDCIERTYPTFKNCFQANPAAPYVVPVVKSWQDEYVDPATVNGFVETDPGYSVTYRLDPREAIVIYGQMPPPGRYMGVQTWVFSQHGKWKPKDYNQWADTPDLPFPMQYLFDTVPPGDPKSHRVITFSALGDVVNNVVMERTSGYPFGENRYFIITPSAATDHALRLALQAQGVSDDHIFTEQIPSRDDFGPIGPIGMGKNAIDFATAFRYAVPDDAADAEKWRNDLPLTVLRVRAPASLGPVKRYGSLIFEPRTATSEAYLAGDLQNLVAAVCDSIGSHANLASGDCTQPPPASSFIPELVRDYGWTGPYCRNIAMDCQADQQEAALFFSSPRSLDSGQILAVVSPLATETGNAIYVGLSANDASIMGGVPDATILDTGLKGSADYYAPVDNPGAFAKFFVHYFARDCEKVPGRPQDCTEITPDMLPPAGDTTAIGDPALHGFIIVSLRDYIAQNTKRGPDAAKLLTPRIITFTQR